MKKRAMRAVSLILICGMLFSLLTPAMLAAGDEEEMGAFPQQEETQEQVVLSTQAGEQDEQVDSGEEIFPDDSQGVIMEGDPNRESALPEGEEQSLGNSLGERFGDDSSLDTFFDNITDDDIIYEEAASPTQENDGTGNDDEPSLQGLDSAELLATPSLTASMDSVTLSLSEEQSVTLTYNNFYGDCYLQAYSSVKNVYSMSWGNWSGRSIPLTIHGLKKGYGKITVYLVDALRNQKKAQVTFKITVCEASVKVSVSSLKIKIGESYTASLSYSGYSGASYARYTTTNASAFDCEWVNGSPLRLKITGRREGSGLAKIYYMSSSGVTLASASVSVTVTDEQPKVTLSATSVKLRPNGKQTVYAAYSGCYDSVYFQYGSTGDSYYSCKWKAWQGNTAPLEITGNSVGSGKVTVYLKRASNGEELACATINPITVEDNDPQLTLSSSAVTLSTGSNKTIKATVTGVTGSYYLSYYTDDAKICSFAWGSWAGNTIPLCITGKSKGSVTAKIRLYRSSGEKLKEVPLSITIYPTDPDPTLNVTPASVTVPINSTQVVKLTFGNYDRSVYLDGSIQGKEYFSCKWGTWSGKTASLYITGVLEGQGEVTVRLRDYAENTVLKTVVIPVKVVGKGNDEVSIEDISYRFKNFSRSMIPKALCQYIFGVTERAEQIYNRNMGSGGCCFGFASSAALILYQAEMLSLNQFAGGFGKISQLNKTTMNLKLNLSVEEIIEAMQVSQAALERTWGVAEVGKILKRELDAGRCVLLSLRGALGGHAVLAYDYTESGNGMSVSIYDSNYPLRPQTLRMTKGASDYSSWSYSPMSYGSGKVGANIGALTYAQINDLWQRRGYEASLLSSDDPIDMDPNYNLLITEEDNFEVLYFDWDLGDQLMLKYQDGVLVYQNPAFHIEEFPVEMMEEGRNLHFVYLPSDEYYTLRDLSAEDGIYVTLVNIKQSVTMDTEADELELVVSDEYEIARAKLKNANEGETCLISIGLMEDGKRTEYRGSGTADQSGSVGLGLNDGNLEPLDGGTFDAISIIREEDSYEVHTVITEGGTVTPGESCQYVEGDLCRYVFTPDEGYVLSSLSVNGKPVDAESGVWTKEFGKEEERTFTLAAEFKRDISHCEIELSSYEYPFHEGESVCPDVSLSTAEGEILKEGVDYRVEYADNQQPGTATVYVFAEEDSVYSGFAQKTFRIQSSLVQSVDYHPANGKAEIHLESGTEGFVYMSIYRESTQQAALGYAIIHAAQTDVTIDLPTEALPEGGYYCIFLLDDQYRPLTVYDSRKHS